MQTKNINIEQAPLNNVPQKLLLMSQPNNHNNVVELNSPPLPPRTAIIFTPLPGQPLNLQQVEVEGYGPYKPVPPPKPLAGNSGSNTNGNINTPSSVGNIQPAALNGQYVSNGSYTPPPYRMPPYPLYGEQAAIPGSAATPTQISTGLDGEGPAAASTPHGLHTHSSKFPIEREVILSSGDKNCKIPILNEYKKRAKVAIAPDVPPKQMAAWTQQHQLQDIQVTEESEDPRTMKKPAGEQGIYGKPRTDQGRQDGITMQQYNQHFIQQQLLQNHQIQMQNQQIQQQIQTQQFKSQFAGQIQIAQSRSQEMLAPRPHPGNQESIYYHGSSYGVTPQRPANRYSLQANSEQTYVMMHHPQFGELKVNTRETYNERLVDDRRVVEPRSPQQIERDNIRRKSFEARRAASQPQLAFDEEDKPTAENGNQSLMTPVRRGSHGNLIESISRNNQESEKDSDDGGFIQRSTYQERKVDKPTDNSTTNEDKSSENTYSKDESKVAEPLTGAPRKKLEGEIGKIEGVYNIGQRIRTLNGEQIDIGDKRGSHRKTNGSGASSDYDKTGGPSSNADSGRGSAAYSSGRRMGNDTSTESSDTHQLPSANYNSTIAPGHDSEWVDIVENELRNILEPKLHELSLNGNNPGVANSTVSESISSMTPPLPPLSPGDGSSPNMTPRNSNRYKHSSLPYGSKPEYGIDSYNKPMKGHSGIMGPGVGNRWHPSSSQKHRLVKKMEHASLLKGKPIFGDITDIASTTTRSLDLDSMMDGHSDSDGDISTTDARAIRKQLEGLEGMYSEVLKLLGVKKHSGRYQPSDPRFSKRRYGSMSSLPSSSVSSRPIRDKRRAHDDRKKVKDLRGINKRFQRLESHVVTLARSVAHLSSEMRTQHLMIQEMENIRGEISALRTQTNMLNVRSQSAARGQSNTSKDLPSLSNPTRVKKLTKFFGDEPPLLRLFLKKLGYEKYANVFENERVGMVELPYLSEERLQKMGVPLGPRLRIMQEAQISVCKDNTLCIV